MTTLRHHLLRHRMLALWLVAVALAMKLAMPVGFMPSFKGGTITVALCTGQGPATVTMAMPGAGAHHDDGGQRKSEPPCAFSGLSAPSVAAADPLFLAVAILFVLALGTRPLLPLSAAAPPYLRPPLRGPPATL